MLDKLCDDINMLRLLRRHWDVIGEVNAFKFEQQLSKFRLNELILFHQKLILKEQIYAILLEIVVGVKPLH